MGIGMKLLIRAALTMPLEPELQTLIKKFEAMGVSISLFQHPEYLKLNSIKVPKERRGEGLGTEFMENLVRIADQYGLAIFLTPSTDLGASSISRLRSFYSRFGFKRNQGRNKDFRSWDGMVRQPRK
jgi:GNAT superfamily N-acetyltransferase